MAFLMPPVEEDTTFLWVQMDGLWAKIWFARNDGSSDAIEFFKLDKSTEIAKSRAYIPVSGYSYGHHDESSGTNNIYIIEVDAPLYKRIRIKGNFYNSSGGALTNSTSINLALHIYPTKIVYDLEWVTSDSITIGNNGTYDSLIGLHDTALNNEDEIGENAGSEDHPGNGTRDPATYDWVGVESPELNAIVTLLYESSSGLTEYQTHDSAGGSLRLDDAIISAGTYRIIAILHLDSAERENDMRITSDSGDFADWDTDLDGNSVAVGEICIQSSNSLRYICHTAHTAGAGNEPPDTDYWHEYRMTLGDQYKDLKLASSGPRVETGSYTGDGNDDKSIPLSTGFGTPDLVIVFSDNLASTVTFKTNAMAGNISCEMDTAAATSTTKIKTLASDAFTLGIHADVNDNGQDFYYIAIRDDNEEFMVCGSYTGNGSTQSIDAGVSWIPNVLFALKGAGTENPYYALDSFSNTCFQYNGSTVSTNKFNGFTSGGFDLQNHAQVTGSGVTFYYILFKEFENFFKGSEYTGDGTDDRAILFDNFRASINHLAIKWGTDSGRNVNLKIEEMPAGESYKFAGIGMVGNNIQDLLVGGFEIGSSNEANLNTTVFDYHLLQTGFLNPDEGNFVRDNKIPLRLGGDGFAADGAWNLEKVSTSEKPSTSNDDLKTGITDAGAIFENMVSCFLLNEVSGTNADDKNTTNNNDLTLGTAMFDAGGEGIDFNGSDTASNTSVLGLSNTQCSVLLTLNPDRLNTSEYIFTLSDGSSNNRAMLYWNGSPNMYLWIAAGGSGANVITVPSVDDYMPVGSDSILIITWDTVADSYDIWINGISRGSSPSTVGNPSGIDEIKLGAGWDGSNPYDGFVKYFVIFDEVLTNNQIAFISKNPYFPFGNAGQSKITADRTRIGMSQVIHDPHIYTGDPSSPTDHLIEYIKTDDNAASSVIVAEVGDNANWETSEGVNRNTNNDDVSTDIHRGTGLDTGDTYHIEHVVTEYDNAYFKQGTKIIQFTPQFAYDDAADQTIWSLYVDAGDYIQITYDIGNDRYELRVSWGGTLTTLNGDAYTESVSLQQLTTIHAAWDSDENILMLAINGQVVDVGTNIGTPSASGAAYVMTGCDCVTDADGTGQLEADIYIDENKAYNNAILPYGGGPFHGNGEVDTDVAHGDILTFIKGDESNNDSLKIGTGNITVSTMSHATDIWGNSNEAFQSTGDGDDADYVEFNSNGNINGTKGKISFWYKYNDSSASTYSSIFGHSSASTNFRLRDFNTTSFYVYAPDGTYMGNDSMSQNHWDGNWHYFEYIYDADENYIEIWQNGILETRFTTSFAGLDVSSGTFIIGNYANKNRDCGSDLSDITISNKPYTPDNWSVLGAGPRHMLIRDKQ